jgi:LysM repeat protein
MEDTWGKKFKILTFSLIASGALNIGLVTAVASLLLSEDKPSGLPGKSKKIAEIEKLTNGAVLQSMSKLSFRELAALLTNRELVEEGYSKRDLALAALTAFHHFHLEKALGGAPTQKRLLAFEGISPIEVYPGLSEEQFDAAVHFAYQEKWPLTSKGLFGLLQKVGLGADDTLREAFAMTPEVYALQTLFQKSGSPQEAQVLIQLITEGNWDLIDRFMKEQSQLLDLSIEKRRRLLLSYLAHQSSTAAYLLLETEPSFVLKKLDDKGVLDLVVLLTHKTEAAAQFCAALLSSPRSDAVLQAAALKLYAFAGEASPAPLDVKAATARFASSLKPAPKGDVAKAAAPSSAPSAPAAKGKIAGGKRHLVKEGESLWKIARQHKVKVDEIVQLNGLEKQTIRPGMNLKIPE